MSLVLKLVLKLAWKLALKVVWVVEVVRAVEEVKVDRVTEVVKMVEVDEEVYRRDEKLGVKGPNNNNKDIGLRMTMPQAAGKKQPCL